MRNLLFNLFVILCDLALGVTLGGLTFLILTHPWFGLTPAAILGWMWVCIPLVVFLTLGLGDLVARWLLDWLIDDTW